jgi:hypothetical protein
MRIKYMAATSTTSGFGVRAESSAAALTQARTHRRRISPQAGHALEILGHAIEYLSDEFVHAGGSFSAHDGQVEAVQLLMQINRQIYLDCPEIPTLSERCRNLFHLRAA